MHHFAQFMIDTARGLGYDLVPVGECLGDPSDNWYRDSVTGQARDAKQASPPPGDAHSKPDTTMTPSSHTTGFGISSGGSSQVPTPTSVMSANFGFGHQGSSDSSASATVPNSTSVTITISKSQNAASAVTTLIESSLGATVFPAAIPNVGAAGPRAAPTLVPEKLSGFERSVILLLLGFICVGVMVMV